MATIEILSPFMLSRLSRVLINFDRRDMMRIGASSGVMDAWERSPLMAINLMDDATLNKLSELLTEKLTGVKP